MLPAVVFIIAATSALDRPSMMRCHTTSRCRSANGASRSATAAVTTMSSSAGSSDASSHSPSVGSAAGRVGDLIARVDLAREAQPHVCLDVVDGAGRHLGGDDGAHQVAVPQDDQTDAALRGLAAGVVLAQGRLGDAHQRQVVTQGEVVEPGWVEGHGPILRAGRMDGRSIGGTSWTANGFLRKPGQPVARSSASVRSSHSANELGGWSPQSQSPCATAVRTATPRRSKITARSSASVAGSVSLPASRQSRRISAVYADSGSDDRLTDCDSARAATIVVARVSFRAITLASTQAWSSSGVSL